MMRKDWLIHWLIQWLLSDIINTPVLFCFFSLSLSSLVKITMASIYMQTCIVSCTHPKPVIKTEDYGNRGKPIMLLALALKKGPSLS